jgi:hypothetical protein
MRTKLRIASAAVLVLGLLAGALIYVAAPDEGASPYTIPPAQSRMYIRELRQFGGKASVLFAELNDWFAGLWQGKALGVTVAWLGVAVAAGLFLFAERLPPEDANPDQT